jgi:serine/threonine protein kinase
MTSIKKSSIVTTYTYGTMIGPYKVEKQVTSGSFGQLYTVSKDNKIYAMKISLLDDKVKLVHEYNLCKHWHIADNYETKTKETNIVPAALPKVYYYAESESECFMIIDFLAMTLTAFKEAQEFQRMSLQQVNQVARELISGLKKFHELGWVHGDIKPDNIMLFYKNNLNYLSLIDFGLSQQYMTDRDHHCKDDRRLTGLRGTLRYASINTHERHYFSRRDDLESTIYVLLFLLHGSLPWQGAALNNIETQEEREEYVCKAKQNLPNLEAFEEDEKSQSFIKAWTMIRQMRFTDIPDYDTLCTFFQ